MECQNSAFGKVIKYEKQTAVFQKAKISLSIIPHNENESLENIDIELQALMLFPNNKAKKKRWKND